MTTNKPPKPTAAPGTDVDLPSSAAVDDAKRASVQETLQKVEASLLPAVESFMGDVQAGGTDTSAVVTPGLDFLHVKNDLLLSYLIDLVTWLRDFSRPASDGGPTTDGGSALRLRRRLLEMRAVLDKSRGLDKKLRYQIDKLLAAASSATSSSFAFATSGAKNGDDEDDDSVTSADGRSSRHEDPLRFRPDPTSIRPGGSDVSDGDEDGDEDEDEEESLPNEDLDGGRDIDVEGDNEDDDLAAARATLSLTKQSAGETSIATTGNKKTGDYKRPSASRGGGGRSGDGAEGVSPKNSAAPSGVYRAPRLTAVPYSHDSHDKQREASKRERRHLRSTELAQTLRAQYGDAPDREDIHGGGSDYGKQRAASRKLAQQEAKRTKYEESAMIRLTTSRKEKKEKKRAERMEGSNLDAITNLGSLVRESQAFGRTSSSRNTSDDEGPVTTKKGRGMDEGDGGRSRHHNGKRSRRTNHY